jgi:hypothetical protein
MARTTKTPAQGKAQGAEADAPAETVAAQTEASEHAPPVDGDVVPDEMPDHEKHELYNRLVEFLSHFDRAALEELSRLAPARLDMLNALAQDVRVALAEQRMEDAVQLAEKLGHSISAALIPDFDADAELAAEGADDEANAAPGVEVSYRVTRDGVFMQNGFPTTIRKGSVISSSKYNMHDVHAAVKKGRLHIEAI